MRRLLLLCAAACFSGAAPAADPTKPPNPPGLPYPGLPTPPEKTSDFVPDSTLTHNVSDVLAANSFRDIRVSSDMGVVSLVGAVDSEETRQRVAKLVSGVHGVKGVETSQIQVKAGR